MRRRDLSLPSSAHEVVGAASQTDSLPAESLSMNESDPTGVSMSMSESEDESVEVEALTYNSQGVVVFDGGHYSAGPDYIGGNILPCMISVCVRT